MTAAALIKDYIRKLPEGKSFSSNELRAFATTENIRQVLNRLAKTGEIKRLARGVFAKPKHNELVGEILPNATEVAKSISQLTGEIISVHGAEAARMLHLTTQTPMKLIFYTSGNTRTLKLNNTSVKLQHVNPSRLIATGTVPGLVICALNFMGKRNVTTNVIKKIKSTLSEKAFSETMQLVNKMPAWMADCFYQYNAENNNEK